MVKVVEGEEQWLSIGNEVVEEEEEEEVEEMVEMLRVVGECSGEEGCLVLLKESEDRLMGEGERRCVVMGIVAKCEKCNW